MAEFLFVIKVAKDQCSDSQCEDLKTAEGMKWEQEGKWEALGKKNLFALWKIIVIVIKATLNSLPRTPDSQRNSLYQAR